jgi:hypothetical protein
VLNIEGLSKRGQQSQSMTPSRDTSAAARQSPINAWFPIASMSEISARRLSDCSLDRKARASTRRGPADDLEWSVRSLHG